MGQIVANFDAPPSRIFCPPGWSVDDLDCRDGAKIAADYWEETGFIEKAIWLRDWAALAPDDHERFRRKSVGAVDGWGRNRKWAKSRRSRIERAACKRNPDVVHGYGVRGLW